MITLKPASFQKIADELCEFVINQCSLQLREYKDSNMDSSNQYNFLKELYILYMFIVHLHTEKQFYNKYKDKNGIFWNQFIELFDNKFAYDTSFLGFYNEKEFKETTAGRIKQYTAYLNKFLDFESPEVTPEISKYITLNLYGETYSKNESNVSHTFVKYDNLHKSIDFKWKELVKTTQNID